jgi:hypothetical protein
MVITPDFVTVADGLTFIVGQITWTTGAVGFTVTATEEVQIQSTSITSSPAMAPTTLVTAPTTPATSPTTPATRHLLPRYKGRQIDNTDLLEAIDQVDLKLSESLALVNSIRDQSTEQVATRHNRSTRPDRARRPAWFDTDLVFTATPEGRTVRLCPVSTTGLRLLHMAWQTLLLSTRITYHICSWILRSRTMFQISVSWMYLDRYLAMLSIWSKFGNFVKAPCILQLQAPDLHIPNSYTSMMEAMIWIFHRTLRVSLGSQGSPQGVATWCSTSAMTSPLLKERLMTNAQCVNSTTPATLNAAHLRLQKRKHVAGDPDLEIWLMPSIE